MSKADQINYFFAQPLQILFSSSRIRGRRNMRVLLPLRCDNMAEQVPYLPSYTLSVPKLEDIWNNEVETMRRNSVLESLVIVLFLPQFHPLSICLNLSIFCVWNICCTCLTTGVQLSVGHMCLTHTGPLLTIEWLRYLDVVTLRNLCAATSRDF